MNITQNQVQEILDALRDYGFTEDDIAQALDLHQVQLGTARLNARSVRKIYSGKTQITNTVYRALRDLLVQTIYQR